jgi:hypothetical protein
VLPVQ